MLAQKARLRRLHPDVLILGEVVSELNHVARLAKGRTVNEVTSLVTLQELDEGSPARRAGANTDGVIISTIHSAKGLEWPIVFMPQLKEGNLPSRDAIRNGDVSEEKRVLFVGVTRAKKFLHLSLSCAAKKDGTAIVRGVSQFLSDERLKSLLDLSVRVDSRSNSSGLGSQHDTEIRV